MVRKSIRHARRSMEVNRPLFPGYVFIASEAKQRWQAIGSTVGVRTLIRCGDEPGYLDGTFVDALLRERETDGVIVKPQSPFQPGQYVSVTHGPFANLIGEIVAMRDNERVMILLQLMGQEVKTMIGTESLSVRT